jgi:hypothetical protein
VEKEFMSSWKLSNLKIPIIQRIYKVIENEAFLQPYDKYKCVIFQFIISRTKFSPGQLWVMRFLDIMEQHGNALSERQEIPSSAVTPLAHFAPY